MVTSWECSMSDAHEPDMLHVPDSLKELLPQKLASINLVVVQIAEYSVGKLEQARQKAELNADLGCIEALGHIKALQTALSGQLCEDRGEALGHIEAGPDGPDSRAWKMEVLEDGQTALSRLQSLSGSRDIASKAYLSKLSDSFEKLQDIRKSAAAVTAKTQVRMKILFPDEGLQIKKLNMIMLDITMWQCQAACYDPDNIDDFLNQIVDAYGCNGTQSEKATKLQLLINYIRNRDDLHLRCHGHSRAIRCSKPWIQRESCDLMQQAMDTAELSEDNLMALCDALKVLTATTDSLGSMAIQAEILTQKSAQNICSQDAKKSVDALSRHLRDIATHAIVAADCCKPKDKNEFLRRAAKAYGGGELDKGVEARLLMSYHLNYRDGFKSKSQVRGRIRPRRR